LVFGRHGRGDRHLREQPVVGAAHPLLQLKNVICTPHLGYCDQEQYEGIYGGAVNRLLAYAEGKPIDVINPEALKRPRRSRL
jgi:D-3-phosphoglycerate dehydrogenase